MGMPVTILRVYINIISIVQIVIVHVCAHTCTITGMCAYTYAPVACGCSLCYEGKLPVAHLSKLLVYAQLRVLNRESSADNFCQ